MKFIVGNNNLQMLGGSETFTFAFVEELVRLGHEVDVICPTLPAAYIGGNVAPDMVKRMWGLGRVVTVNCPLFSMDGEILYDAAFLSHNTTVEKLFRMFPNFPPEKVIQTIHGQYDKLEMPYHDGHRMIQFVTVSDELREIHPFVRTIMNGVNLDRFKPAEKVPGSVLSMCQSDSFNAMLSEICAELGLSFKSRNKFTNPIWNIEDELSTAEIAIGIGRSAIEAMACGCAVIVADDREYQSLLFDGAIRPETYHQLSLCNFSGRRYATPCDSELIQIALHSVQPFDGEYNRAHAEAYHDIRKQVQRYLEMV